MPTSRAPLHALFAVLAACASNSGPTPASVPTATAPAMTTSSVSAMDSGAAVITEDTARPATELWEGTLEAGPGVRLRLVLHVTRAGDGSLKATCDSLDQGAKGIPVDTVTRDARTLAFTMAGIGAEYSGKLNDAQTEVVGTFRQRGAALPLSMARVEKASTLPRPQTPRPPFPYRSEDVTYRNAAGGSTLAGTLTMPAGEGPFAAVILISGSGPQDRDETLFEHKPFLVIADDLTRKGIAVLRVDDRGVGGSTGSLATSTSEDLAGDVLAGLAYLESRREIDRARLGLIGHSEGGLIAPMVAARSKAVAFMVLLAGPGLPGSEILLLQGALVARAAGLPEDQVARAGAMNKRIHAVLASTRDDAEAAAKIRAILAEAPGAAKGNEDAVVAQIVSPWFRFFVTYDPRPALAKVKCPVLALNGEKDLQVPPREDLAAIKKANPRIVTKELPGLNHLFQTASTGNPSDYPTIPETFAPAALAEISAFVLAQTRAK